MLSRREALRITAGLLAAPILAAATGCGSAGRAVRRQGTPRLWPVHVDSDRVIRIVTGLRPYRPGGFVVRPERFSDTLVVHNYGHGGAGVTLSWGSAELAAELVVRSDLGGDIAVLGCGVIGLTTALRLLRQGHRVTIYARDLPPETTSNAAGASFYPSDLVAEAGLTAPFLRQVTRAARISHRTFQTLVGAEYGVQWRKQYYFADGPEPAPWPLDAFPELFPDPEHLQPGTHPFGDRHVYVDNILLIEVPVYLRALVRDVRRLGGRIVVRDFSDRQEVLELPERRVVNCTGLGAKKLFGDDELEPSKSQLVVLLPQTEIDYAMAFGEYWMLPRRDGILLGGAPRGLLETTEPDAQDTARIISAHEAMSEMLRTAHAA